MVKSLEYLPLEQVEIVQKLNPKYLSYIINKELKLIEDNTGYITVKHLSSNTIKDLELGAISNVTGIPTTLVAYKESK